MLKKLLHDGSELQLKAFIVDFMDVTFITFVILVFFELLYDDISYLRASVLAPFKKKTQVPPAGIEPALLLPGNGF